MARYWKATRLNGTDFFTGAIDYAYAQATGQPVVHPRPERGCSARGYFSVATTATDCTGMEWPCRLFVVEPIGETWVPDPSDLPHKVACLQLRVVEELPATLALGPQGEQVAALIERRESLTSADAKRLDAAWSNNYRGNYCSWREARGVAYYHGRAAAWEAAAIRSPAMKTRGLNCRFANAAVAAEAAISALVSRDLISREDYEALTGAWRHAIGPLHPDDDAPRGSDR